MANKEYVLCIRQNPVALNKYLLSRPFTEVSENPTSG